MELRAEAGLLFWKSDLLDRIPGVWHGITSRHGGVSGPPFASLNLSTTVGDDLARVALNRRMLARAANVPDEAVRLETQVHGADIHQLGRSTRPRPLTGDAFFTTDRGLPVAVGVADCLPVLMASDDGSVVAAVHAGWRGAAAGIASLTVSRLTGDLGVCRRSLNVALGPCIGPRSFEVGAEVSARFSRAHVTPLGNGKALLDLAGAVREQLVDAGVHEDRIESANVCTLERQDLCFSHRGSGGATGRMVAMIVRNGT